MLKSKQLLLVITAFILVSVPLTIYLGLKSDENSRNPQAATLCTTNCNSSETNKLTATTSAIPQTFKSEDLNKDGKINGADLAILLTKIGKTYYPAADFNKDGVVNRDDQAILIASWGK